MIGYPLLLQPQYDEKLWGGRRLETVLGKSLPSNTSIGESLESGDGAIVAVGRLAGQTLGDLTQRDPESLLGCRGQAASGLFGDFPLLVKFIDASEVLSLQVHPDDGHALPLRKRGKTEAWHIVDAEPGAHLITGLTYPASADEVRQAISDSTFESLIERRPVTTGDTVIVPAGTLHAIGAGVLLYEIQETSDVTFRLYDWGRVDASGKPRDLHLNDGLQALVPSCHATPTSPLPLDDHRSILVACRYFALERWSVQGELPVPTTGGASFRLLTCIGGSCEIHGDRGQPLPLHRGQTALLPADFATGALTGEATLLCGWIADLAEDVVGPLLAAGHHPQHIAMLAGQTGDLWAALAESGHEQPG